MIEKVSLDKLEIVSNMVLVRLDPDYDFIEVPGANGTKVTLQLVDFTKTQAQLQSITGTILKTPETLSFHAELQDHKKGETISEEEFNSLMRTTMPYEVTMDVKEGDSVIFDVKHATDAEECGLLVDVEGIGYAVLMTYEALYAKQVGDTVVPLNGWVIFMRDQKPNEWKTESGLWVCEKVDKYGSSYGTVIKADKPRKRYIEIHRFDPDVSLVTNDRIIINRRFGYRMADDSFGGKVKGMEIIDYGHILAILN